MSAAQETIGVTLPARPTEIELDPDAMVMRRVPRQDLPPVLNHYVTDGSRSVVLAYSDPPNGSHPFREIVNRIESQDSRKPAEERSATFPLAKDTLLPREGSMLVLGSPESRAELQSLLSAHCGDRLQIRDGGVTVSGTTYDGAEIAALVSCHRRDRPGSVVTLLYAVTPRSATTVARLLFFYGWNSYVIFKDGTAVARGEWATTHDRMEVTLDEQDVGR